jgi:hypothetical protein
MGWNSTPASRMGRHYPGMGRPLRTKCHVPSNFLSYRVLYCLTSQSKMAEYSILFRKDENSRSRSSLSIRRGSAAACLSGMRVRILPGGNGCLSVVSVVCCQVEVSAAGRSLFQRRPVVWCACVCVCVSLSVTRRSTNHVHLQ